MKIEWTPRALIRWRNLGYVDAETIDRAVQRWAEHGEGSVTVDNRGILILRAGRWSVELLIDDDSATVYVMAIA